MNGAARADHDHRDRARAREGAATPATVIRHVQGRYSCSVGLPLEAALQGAVRHEMIASPAVAGLIYPDPEARSGITALNALMLTKL